VYLNEISYSCSQVIKPWWKPLANFSSWTGLTVPDVEKVIWVNWKWPQKNLYVKLKSLGRRTRYVLYTGTCHQFTAREVKFSRVLILGRNFHMWQWPADVLKLLLRSSLLPSEKVFCSGLARLMTRNDCRDCHPLQKSANVSPWFFCLSCQWL